MKNFISVLSLISAFFLAHLACAADSTINSTSEHAHDHDKEGANHHEHDDGEEVIEHDHEHDSAELHKKSN